MRQIFFVFLCRQKSSPNGDGTDDRHTAILNGVQLLLKNSPDKQFHYNRINIVQRLISFNEV